MTQGELAVLLAKVKDDKSDTLDLSREELEYLPPETDFSSPSSKI